MQPEPLSLGDHVSQQNNVALPCKFLYISWSASFQVFILMETKRLCMQLVEYEGKHATSAVLYRFNLL